MKVEGRTQLVGYAHRNGLVKTLGEARKMNLELLRLAVADHRKQNQRDDENTGVLTATTAEERE